MAYAIRRLLLRTRAFRYRRAQLQFTDRRTIAPWQTCRQFHPSAFRLDDKPEPRKRGRPRKAKATDTDPKADESDNGVVASPQRQSKEEKTQLSVSSELGVDLGATELTPEFRQKVDELTEAGDIEGLLELANTEAMSASERRELDQLMKKNSELLDRARVLQKLSKMLTEHPEDLDSAHELMKEAGMHPQELFAPPSDDVATAFRADDKNIDLSDPEKIDKQFWKSLTSEEEPDEDREAQDRLIRELIESGTAGDESLQRQLRRNVMEKQKGFEKAFGVDGRLDLDFEKETPGFFNYEDPDAGEDEEFNQDDLPAKGHQELELHREIREYARMAIWDLPLLSSE
jgi:hypothetical protein